MSEPVASAEAPFAAGDYDATLDRLRQLDDATLTTTSQSPALAALTEREREVALAATEGATNRMIAGNCSTSVRTVETQLSSVYRKLGISSRHQLGALLADDA